MDTGNNIQGVEKHKTERDEAFALFGLIDDDIDKNKK